MEAKDTHTDIIMASEGKLHISSIPDSEHRVNFHDQEDFQGDNVSIRFLLPSKDDLTAHNINIKQNRRHNESSAESASSETEKEQEHEEDIDYDALLEKDLVGTFQTAQDVAYLKYFVENATGIPLSVQGMYIDGEPMLDPLSLADIEQIDPKKENAVRVVIEEPEDEDE